MYKLYSLLITTTFISCVSQQPDNDVFIEKNSEIENKIPVSEFDTDLSQQNDSLLRFKDSIQTYFANPFDFYSLKKKTMHMHTGHAPDFKEDFLQNAPDSTCKFYCYWAVEFDLKKEGYNRSLVFATWKPWNNSNAKQYETDNEHVVGVRSKIQWKELGASDFVGRIKNELLEKFGEPHHSENNCMIYTQNENLLVLHSEKEKIDWFKYFLIDTMQIDPLNLPDEFLQFKD